MIKCERWAIELRGTPTDLLEEFCMIAISLRAQLMSQFDADDVLKMMDAAYKLPEEDETC